MYNYIIEKYISKLTIDQIIDYGNKNNIYLNINEANIIIEYIKNYWKELMYGNPTKIFNKLKDEITKENYEKIENLYYIMREKYT